MRTDHPVAINWLPRLAVLAVTVAGVLMVIMVWWKTARYQACPPSFDEAVHTLPIFEAATDLRQFDLAALLQHAYRQDELANYPFLHSWMVAPGFLLFGPTLTVARVANVLLLGLAVVATYFLAKTFSPKSYAGSITGVTAAALLLSAMPLWVYASQVFLEAAGLLITTACLAAYAAAGPGQSRERWLLVTSGLMVAAFFTKFSFGVLLSASIALAELLFAAFSRSLPLRRWGLLFAPAGLLVLAWFANPGKLDNFLSFSRSQQANIDAAGLADEGYYLRSLFHVYYASPITGGLAILGLFWGLLRIREHRHRGPTAYILVVLLILTLVVPQKEHRFTYTLLSSSAALASGALWELVAAVRRRLAFRRSLSWLVNFGLLSVLVVQVRLSILRYTYFDAALEMTFACPPQDSSEAYSYVLDHSQALEKKPYLLNQWHLFNQHSLIWARIERHRWPNPGPGYHLASGGLAPAPTEPDLAELLASLHEQDVSLLVSIDGSPAGDYSGWQVVEPLWAAGALELLASSGRFTMVSWTRAYEEQALVGRFRDRADQERARRDGQRLFQIQLHLYTVH